ncbi:hypothetical protein WK36_16305 [Burkholderia cepacia]|nr:hypothetical protein VL00_20795 [Burkholderia cepacia]KML36819.1 hypothetical protein VL13_27675 [Burkholderia lata]KMN53633.1 hypothetical protein VK92_27875 [Burkholderia sp. LK4]KVS34939.1 hypothetical protein WK36_16305 [Burkholderia cepacia]
MLKVIGAALHVRHAHILLGNFWDTFFQIISHISLLTGVEIDYAGMSQTLDNKRRMSGENKLKFWKGGV